MRSWSSVPAPVTAAATAVRQLNPAAGEQVAAAMAMLPAEMFPETAAVAAEMVGYGSDEHYEYVLERLVR
jgi:hypothetical protein